LRKRAASTQRNPQYDWPILIGLILIGAMLAIRMWVWQPASTPQKSEPQRLQTAPLGDNDSQKKALAEALSTKALAIELQPADPQRPELWYVYGTPGEAVLALHRTVRQVVDTLPIDVVTAISEPASAQVMLSLGHDQTVFLQLRLIARRRTVEVKGRIALIIDDFGAHWDAQAQGFGALGVPLTVSVIPSMKKASTVATGLSARGCEVLLHMPMEPFDTRYSNEPMLLKAGASHFQIKRLLDEALRKVPGVVGINNHMGSKATSHRETMTRFMRELKQRRLFFVDSRTSVSTVAYDVARELGVPTAKRQVFLDSEDTVKAIRRQMHELARTARQKGEALAIGHCRRRTLAVLKESIPRLQNDGYEFIFVSQLTR